MQTLELGLRRPTRLEKNKKKIKIKEAETRRRKWKNECGEDFLFSHGVVVDDPLRATCTRVRQDLALARHETRMTLLTRRARGKKKLTALEGSY